MAEHEQDGSARPTTGTGGAGAPARVVLVPGFAQTASSWGPVVEALAGRCRTEAVEVPVRQSFAATAAALGDHGPAVFVGYSMGGRLVLRLALDRPTAVRGLVLVSASPGIADPDDRAERRAADERLAREAERDGVAAFLDRWEARPMFAGVPAGAPGAAERRHLPLETVTAGLRALGTGTMEPLWDRLAELRMPVAVVTGTRDAAFDARGDAMAVRLRPGPTRVRVDGGHALPLEAPEALAEVVVAFVASVARAHRDRR